MFRHPGLCPLLQYAVARKWHVFSLDLHESTAVAAVVSTQSQGDRVDREKESSERPHSVLLQKRKAPRTADLLGKPLLVACGGLSRETTKLPLRAAGYVVAGGESSKKKTRTKIHPAPVAWGPHGMEVVS